jgi:hypothetical protein
MDAHSSREEGGEEEGRVIIASFALTDEEWQLYHQQKEESERREELQLLREVASGHAGEAVVGFVWRPPRRGERGRKRERDFW